MAAPFVPPSFEVPQTHEWPGFHLEPLGARHNVRDHEAWMSSIPHIRSTPGFSEEEEPGWPEPMTLEANLEDLVRHSEDFAQRKGFTYSILDGDEVVGCVYIYPDKRPVHDAWVSSWVRESRAGSDVAVREALSAWIDEVWPFEAPYYAGIESTGGRGGT